MSVRKTFERFFYFFPVQLVVIQIRLHKTILLFWLLLFLMIGDVIGTQFGIPYLFLDPEYLGEVNFWSMFMIGAGMGVFIAAFQIATYILDSYRFHFLALEKHPFFIFFLNNLLIPVSFVAFYVTKFISFQMTSRGGWDWEILGILGAMFLGMLGLLLFIAVYFFRTNKNIIKVFGPQFAKDLRRPKAIIDKAKVGMNVRYRVDSMIVNFKSVKEVNRNIRADFRTLVKVLNQHHGNALLLELILLVVIMSLGLLDSNPYFQIPTATSVLLLFSIFLMVIAAFTFWFRKLGILSFLLAIGFYVLLTMVGFFEERHPAYGMDYEIEPAAYNANTISAIASPDNIYSDFEHTIRILETWKHDHQIWNGPDSKPKAILLCTSGGGLRASYFTLRSMQVLDSMTEEGFIDQTRLISGASGGVIGAAVFRELDLRREMENEDAHDKKWAEGMGKDLLNRVSFRIVTGFLLPNLSTQIGDQRYAADRGFAFDDQLRTNLNMFHDTRLADYTKPEEDALTPMMIMSPVCINDGRKIYISSTPIAYMSRNMDQNGGIEKGITGIEFQRFFKKQDADSLLFVTALRMNASFPLITPYVQLPSEPVLRVIDAGIVDNFGILTATKFLYVFRDWFAKNTSGVMVVQIRDTQREVINPQSGERSWLGMLDPVGNTYSSYMLSKDVALDDQLEIAKTWFKGNLESVMIEYNTEVGSDDRASLNWHLTEREIRDLERSVYDDENAAAMLKIKKWLAN